MGLFGPPNIEKLKAKKNIKGLIKALGYKKDLDWDNEERRRVAATALGEIGDTRAVKPLISALGDMNCEVREAAAKALHKVGWQPDKGVQWGGLLDCQNRLGQM